MLPIPKDGGNSPFKYGRKRARKIFRGIIFNNIWFHRQVLGRTIGPREVYFWADLSDMNRSVMALCQGVSMEKVGNHVCPRCGQVAMNVYYSDETDNRVGAWCEYCNMKAYYHGEELVKINS